MKALKSSKLSNQDYVNQLFFKLKPYLLSVTIIANIFKIYVFVSNLVFILLHYNLNLKIIVNNSLLSFLT